MKLWSAQSISGRLRALVLLVSGTALLLAYASFLAYDFYSLRQNLLESLETQASIVGANCETALLFDDPQAAETTLLALRSVPNILHAEVLRADNRNFANYQRTACRTNPSFRGFPAEGILRSGYRMEQCFWAWQFQWKANWLGVHPR